MTCENGAEENCLIVFITKKSNFSHYSIYYLALLTPFSHAFTHCLFSYFCPLKNGQWQRELIEEI